MASGYGRLKVTQISGFAGEVALPPLVDLDRRDLNEAGRAALDEACGKLMTAARDDAVRSAIGADLGGYFVEIVDTGGAGSSFTLPGWRKTASLAGESDVPQLLNPLLNLSGGAS